MAKRISISLPRLSDLTLQVKLEGKWTTLENLGDNLGNAVKTGYDIAIQKFSSDLLRIIVKSLTTGIPPVGGGVVWEPLSPATIKRYGKHNIYYLTGLYSRSVGLFKYRSRTLVGLPYNTRRSSQKKLTMNQLAIILEQGTSDGRIPARPVWAPSLKAVGGKGKLKKSILTEIRRQLLKYGVRPNQVK